jgi:hypothetical protein
MRCFEHRSVDGASCRSGQSWPCPHSPAARDHQTSIRLLPFVVAVSCLALLLATFFTAGCSALGKKASPTETSRAPAAPFKIVYCKDRNICIGTVQDDKLSNEKELTGSHKDLKPSWSKTGNKIVFLRYISGGTYPGQQKADFRGWKTRICVMNADGSGLKELTSGDYADFNPTWMRDGSNRILFIRWADPSRDRWETYLTSPDAKPGDEELLADAALGFSSLSDGSVAYTGYGCIWLSKGPFKSPETAKQCRVVPSLPPEVFLPRPSISPDEKKILYAADFCVFRGTYGGLAIQGDSDDFLQRYCFLYVAELNRDQGTITNPRLIRPKKNFDSSDGYNRWSPDGTKVIFHSSANGGVYQLYLYDVERGGEPVLISPDKSAQYMFPCAENTPI